MLHYELTEPRSAGKEPRYAMVLHGLGDSMAGWMPVVDELGIASLGYVFIDAPEPYFGGWSWFPIPGMTAAEHGPEDMIAGVRRSHAALLELLDHLEREHGLPRERIVPMGFSQGCTMVLDLTIHSERGFPAMVGISGFYPLLGEGAVRIGPAAGQPDILLTHGRYDSVLPIARTRAVVERLADAGMRIDWREYDKDHGLDPLRELPELRQWLQEHDHAVAG